MLSRGPYGAKTRKLVLAFDVGTTYSGISYSILEPGEVPKIIGVTSFPAQDSYSGSRKIPTVIYYDKSGKVRAVGAEATLDIFQDTIEEEGLVKAEWFKLHMRPKSISGPNSISDIPPLPAGKDVVDIFSDYYRYLYTCAKKFISDANAYLPALWTSLESTIEYVLTHPNGWEGAQQQELRRAAIKAGLVQDNDEGHARIRFVTEGEASLQFCICNGLTTEALKKGDAVLIVDAGGGTIDMSVYGEAEHKKDTFEELAAPECYLQGSLYVTLRAKAFLQDFLEGSKFADDIEAMVTYFDKSAKQTFDSNSLFLKFGSARDTDLKLGIRGGRLTLLGEDVQRFFEPSISCIAGAMEIQCTTVRKPISAVFLVGGFSASNYLFTKLKEAVKHLNLNLCRPDSNPNRAVADGAVSFYLDHSVCVRVSKYIYGTTCCVKFNASNPEHRARSSVIFDLTERQVYLPDAFDIILNKGVQVSETQEFRSSYYRSAKDQSDLGEQIVTIYCYRGTERPRWFQNDGLFTKLCTVEADTSANSKSLSPQPSINIFGRLQSEQYFKMAFDIVLSFGLTELKAQIAWKEGGVEKRSPARIVYDVVG